LRDWVYDVYRAEDGPALSGESPQIRWLYDLYARENRTDRMVKRLMERSSRMLDDIRKREDRIIVFEGRLPRWLKGKVKQSLAALQLLAVSEKVRRRLVR
jgi:hypothetical protein